MLLPNPPWYRRWSVILAGIIGLAAITALLGWRGLQQVASPATTAPSVTTAPATSAPGTTSAEPPIRPSTTVRRDGVLWRKTGSDVHKSPLFSAPERWRIVWSFDCSNFKKYGAGNFKITGDGAFRRVDIQAFELMASGTESVTGGGFGHLSVDSVCRRWTVKAVAG